MAAQAAPPEAGPVLALQPVGCGVVTMASAAWRIERPSGCAKPEHGGLIGRKLLLHRLSLA